MPVGLRTAAVRQRFGLSSQNSCLDRRTQHRLDRRLQNSAFMRNHFRLNGASGDSRIINEQNQGAFFVVLFTFGSQRDHESGLCCVELESGESQLGVNVCVDQSNNQ